MGVVKILGPRWSEESQLAYALKHSWGHDKFWDHQGPKILDPSQKASSP